MKNPDKDRTHDDRAPQAKGDAEEETHEHHCSVTEGNGEKGEARIHFLNISRRWVLSISKHSMLCVLSPCLSPPLGVPSPKKFNPQTKKLGRNIARLRAVAKLTQEQLAERADISTRYVQDLEAGMYVPTIFLAASLRSALECEWDDLLKGC